MERITLTTSVEDKESPKSPKSSSLVDIDNNVYPKLYIPLRIWFCKTQPNPFDDDYAIAQDNTMHSELLALQIPKMKHLPYPEQIEKE